MGLWSNIKDQDVNNASGTKGGVYLKASLEGSNYTVLVHRCSEKETRKKVNAFIAELEVVATDNENCPVGYRPSFFVQDNPLYPDMALGNIADFLRAGLASMAQSQGGEEEPDDIELTKAIGEACTGEENLLAGTYLQVYVYNKKTKEKKEDFTHHVWSVPANVAELVAQ